MVIRFPGIFLHGYLPGCYHGGVGDGIWECKPVSVKVDGAGQCFFVRRSYVLTAE